MKGTSLGTKLSALKRFILDKSKIDDLTKCALCPNMCRFACPINIVHARETTSPAGKSRIAYLLRENFIPVNQDNVEPLYYCINCDACSVHCPYSYSVNDLIKPMRSNILSSGIYPSSINALINNLKESKCIYPELKTRVSGSINNEEKIDVLYFPGCIALKYYENEVMGALRIFEKIGFKASLFNKPIDCGYIAYELGIESLFIEIARSLVDELNKFDARFIVSPCPECVYMLREVYPHYKIKVRAKIYHTLEFISNHLDKLDLRISDEATYHDSTTLSIKLDEPELLLDVLSRLGIKVISPVRYGKNSFETASENSILYWVNKDLANEINKERFNELRRFSSKIIVPSYASKKSLEGFGGEVIEIMEFLLKEIEKR